MPPKWKISQESVDFLFLKYYLTKERKSISPNGFCGQTGKNTKTYKVPIKTYLQQKHRKKMYTLHNKVTKTEEIGCYNCIKQEVDFKGKEVRIRYGTEGRDKTHSIWFDIGK